MTERPSDPIARSRIQTRFAALRARGQKGLIPYICAGDPDLAATIEIVRAMGEAGADVIELGIPFSDPLVDGRVIQAANDRALAGGATLPRILAAVAEIRRASQVALVLMGSFNPVYAYGADRLARDAAAAGIDGIIITDLPPEEAGEWKDQASAAGIDTIMLLAPTSTPERVAIASKLASGFVYAVSRTGVTGARDDVPTDLADLIGRIRAGTDCAVAVGFGIHTPDQVRAVTRVADAAVVGSALVERIHAATDKPGAATRYIHELRTGLAL
jgi:tryptophan synthase alpha chain